MNRIDQALSKLFTIVLSILFTLILVELGANYYLWNIASEEQFKLFASLNQFQERYGDSFLVTDANLETESGKDALFIPHHYLPYVPKPNLETETNRHNALGFRGDDITLPKPEGVYRIVAIGGSTTYDTGVDDYHDAYPNQLQTYLHEQGYENVEVINAGVPGYTSHESLLNLQFRVLPLEPDLIIIYHAINDAHARLVLPFSAYRADNSGYRAPNIQKRVMPSIAEYSTFIRIIGIQLGWFNSHNSLEWTITNTASTSRARDFELLYRGVPTHGFNDYSPMEIIENNPPIYFESNLLSMVGIADVRDVDVMFSTWAFSPDFPEFPTVASEEYQYMFEQHNEVIRSVAEQTGAYLYDFALDMPQDKQYYVDGRHMTVEGNRLRAQLYGDYLIETVLGEID